MFSLRPRTLNQALGRLLIAVTVPLLLGTLAVLALQVRQEHRLVQAHLGTLAQTLVLSADAEFARARAQLEVLAASPLVDAQDWKMLNRFAGNVVRRVPGGVIILVGPDGVPLFNTAAPDGRPLQNLWTLADESRDTQWEGRRLPLSSGDLSRYAFQTGEPQYSDLYFGVQTARPSLAVSIPVLREGTARYALVLAFSPQLLQERVLSSVTGPDMRALLVDRNVRVVASNGAASAHLGDKAMPMAIRPGSKTGSYQLRARDGTPVVGAYAVSTRTGYVMRVSQPDTASLLPTGAASLAWLALLLAAVLSSGLLASVFSRRLARPLRELGEDVRAGRPPAADRHTGIAEIDLLTQALRDGADAERRRVEEQMLRTVAQSREALLRQADRQKDEFLATLAHELRNPLAPIRTAAELIRLRAPRDPIVGRARDTIERQTLHLSRLVDDLLDVSRITLGRIQLRKEPVDVGEVAAAALETISEAAAQGQVAVDIDIAHPAPFVRGDATRLMQCIVNVLGNAVKFTPAGGRAMLRVAREGAAAVIEVRDTGVGITAENLQRIFELFVQERHSGHQGNSGLGIGLALTRRLVELHDGHIIASSQGLGHGSTIRMEMPAIDAPPPPPAVEAGSNIAPSAGGARVLVVDDNRDAAESMADLLGMSGYVVDVANDGAAALRAVAAAPPAAVLLDIGLPDMDGYEVCRRIRADAGVVPQPVIIAVTGWGQRSDQDAAGAAGFDAHLTKPVDIDQLLRLLHERIRSV